MAYSEAFKAAAIIRWAESGNDFDLTAQELGCSPRALRNWVNGEHVAKKPAKRKELHKKSAEAQKEDLTVADYLEQAVKYMLQNPPSELKGSAWATTVGVLMDKWLLVKGQPTERTETLTGFLNRLPDDEFNDVLQQAEAIIQEASSGDYSGGWSEPG